MRHTLISLALFPSLSLFSCKTSEASRPSSDPLAKEIAKEIAKKPEAEAPLGLGMNDVSVLFPNHQNPAYLEQMPSLVDKPNPTQFAPGLDAAPEDDQAFVPDWVGQELTNNYQNQPQGSLTRGPAEVKLSSFRVASFRVDPCPNDIQVQGKDAYCVRQLRITWQVQDRMLGPFAMDSNVHTAYRLNDGQFKEVLATLRKMHKEASLDTMAMPLTVHPVIVKEGPQSPYLKAALGILHRYARSSNLMIVAGLKRNDFESWSMTQFSLNAGKIVQPKLIAVKEDPAAVPARTQLFAANRATGSSFLGVSPQSAVATPLTAAMPEVIAHAESFENPKLHNALMVDCSSCHQSVHVTRLKSATVFPSDATKAYTSAAWNIEWDKSANADNTSLQMFSFSSAKPKITPRVINETANVLDYLKANGL